MNVIRSRLPTIFNNIQYLTNSPHNIRKYAFKSDLKIKWIRPTKIECYKPERSGDLKSLPEIDKTQYQYEFRNCKELETSSDVVKKLFSLEFAPRHKTIQIYKNETMNTVRRHDCDVGSIETKIARWTGAIHALQEVMDNFPRNKRLKVKLKELIEKRKKHLKYLRRWDYKRFEWLLENLGIVYKPPPVVFYRVSRKDSLRKLTDKYCDGIKRDRLTEYRLKLEEEQPAFLEEKINTLEEIQKEQQAFGMEVTVSQEEIDSTKNQLKLLQEKIKIKDVTPNS